MLIKYTANLKITSEGNINYVNKRISRPLWRSGTTSDSKRDSCGFDSHSENELKAERLDTTFSFLFLLYAGTLMPS